ncbi:hypothetical protein P5673_027257 [Acropora cervicornis]|uniref:Uncharacterized protein n=1 Tax=Acropora cervicornis TaxID=6130 RepID=A0AAD9PZN9_ACRCE|nr:hypothetical protein P5673_027257 [Acropora cervicornis]
MAATRTLRVEVKYINSKHVVIHSENCKVEIPLDITAQQLSKKNCCIPGSYEASKKRGFTDSSTEMFYVDYTEAGQPKKAPYVLRTDDQLSMFFKSESNSILLRVIQRIVQFEKSSVNILMEKDEKSCEVELSTSSNSKSSNDGVSKESTRTVIPSHSRKRLEVTRSQDPKRLAKIEDLKECLWRTDERLPEVRLTQIIQALCEEEQLEIAKLQENNKSQAIKLIHNNPFPLPEAHIVYSEARIIQVAPK